MDKYIEELKSKLNLLDGREKIHTLNLISEHPTHISPTKAIEYAKEALTLSQTLSYQKGKAVALKNIGLSYIYLGDCEKSIEYSLEALNFLQDNSDNKEISIILANIGSAYGSLSDYDKALEYYFKALEYKEKLNAEKEIGVCLVKIGIIYWCLEDYDNALKFCEKSLPLHEKSNNYAGIGSAFTTMGLVYKHFEEYEKALNYYNKANIIAKEHSLKDVEAAALINLGYIYCKSKDFNKALKYYNESLSAHKLIDYKAGIATNLLYLGNLYMQINNLSEALNYLQQALVLATETKVKKIIHEIYFSLSDYYVKAEDYKTALHYFKLHSEVKDKTFSENSRNKIERLQNKYELENKEKEKEIYRLKNIELAKANESLLLANEEIKQKNKELLDAYEKLELMAKTDYLTKLWNRAHILEKIDEERLKFKICNKPFVIIIADIDHFKSFNDKYGHDCGDFILASISKDMCSIIRPTDSLARWGGEEFLFLLPETSMEEGYIISENIRKTISNKIYLYHALELSVTLTLGVCEYNEDISIQNSIDLADKALYKGKKSTKNCVIKASG